MAAVRLISPKCQSALNGVKNKIWILIRDRSSITDANIFGQKLYHSSNIPADGIDTKLMSNVLSKGNELRFGLCLFPSTSHFQDMFRLD